MRRQLRSLRDHDRIDIPHLEAPGSDHLIGTTQQNETIRIFPLWIGIWKVTADVAERRCTQNGIRHGMAQRIGV